MRKLLLATTNRGKAREYRELLAGLPFLLTTLVDEGITFEVAEHESSFEGNARLKATSYAAASGLITLADDSGLEVDALNGEPGVHSARYAGDNATDAERVQYLLGKLSTVPQERRTACFRCVIALAENREKVTVCYGSCDGSITFEPKGSNGFGYDPVFYLPEYGKTMAELTSDVKNQVSHRGRAAREMYKVLKRYASLRGDRYGCQGCCSIF
ncbi:MAG TPA: non-canonical purine NTP pyrophosphatase [Dehalococcoidia bacterium]|nr:non-canonical purine NTP pyrophosphatase [Dehalococcoidia bacterium]